jgi:4-phospho-D-threonate 3-dehydrogenase / 4-phospho-D-erythronate 3-dehydrogenase
MKKIAITLGDPNGISPEITIKALNFLDLPKNKVVLIANKCIFDYYKTNFDLCLEKDYEILEIPFSKENIKLGKETEEAGEFAFCTLKKACDLAINKEISAIVTAPLSKNAMQMAGHNYSGQTEVLEQYLANINQHAEMLFMCDKFSVLLLTRHVALKDVPTFITKEMIVNKIKSLANSFKTQLKIDNPRIAICALNPHSGENGLFGDEEELEIIPAIQMLKSLGINIKGPFPSDTLFTNCLKENCDYDCFVAMYHDQGLIPIKLLEQDNAVNTTIGLDVLRTSPAHGTAFDIAGKNIANPNSMIRAIELAINI